MKFTIIALLLLFVIAAFMAPTPAAACCHTYRSHAFTCSHSILYDDLGWCETFTDAWLEQVGTGKGFFTPQPTLGCTAHRYVVGYDSGGHPIYQSCTNNGFESATIIDCPPGGAPSTHATMESEIAEEKARRESREAMFRREWQIGEEGVKGQSTVASVWAIAPKCGGGAYVPAWINN